MHNLRQIVKDRISFSAILALFAVVLLLQGLSTGFARGAIASASVDPFNILCFAEEQSSVQHTAPVDGPAKHAQCPCATLCQQTQGVAMAVLVSPDALVRPDGLSTAGEGIPDHLVPYSLAPGLVAEARAPPVSSIV